MRAILRDFKGDSSASELVADVSAADIFCQNMYGENVTHLKNSPLFSLIILAYNLHHRSVASGPSTFHPSQSMLNCDTGTRASLSLFRASATV